jgi:hypothetical protein
MTTLFRPVGLYELALIWDSGMRAFPRLPHQPIFYPVANSKYATQIARDWNQRDSASGFAGYVTRFSVSSAFIAKFEPRTVGSDIHVEYWIPADQLREFNSSTEGLIRLESGFFGSDFKGIVPDRFGLKGKDAVAQFVTMAKTWDYSRMDFVCEVSTNRKAIFLNYLFWAQFDFTKFGITREQRDATVGNLRTAWEFNKIEILLPDYSSM